MSKLYSLKLYLIIICCFLSANSVKASLLTNIPNFALGQEWVIKVEQYNPNSPVPELMAPVLHTYTVIDEAIFDGVAVWELQVKESATDTVIVSGLVRKSDRQLLRVAQGEFTTDIALLEQGIMAQSSSSPVITESSEVPFDFPVLMQTKNKQEYQYVPALTQWGFALAITQTQKVEEQTRIIELTQGSKHITQTWNDTSPWWQTSEVHGVYKAQQVSFKHTPVRVMRSSNGTRITSKLNKQAWSYPRSGSIDNAGSGLGVRSNTGESTKTLWSGYWWQSSSSHGEVTPTTRTYADGGLLEKYDNYAHIHNKPDGAKQWEIDHYSHPDGQAWYGHCNGWASAAIIFSEPKYPVVVDGIEFTVGDQKGLLSELGYDVNVSYWLGKRFNSSNDDLLDPSPYEVHRAVIEQLGIKKRPLVADIDNQREVWNFPFYRYELAEQLTDDNRLKVKMKLWFASASVPANYVGLKSFNVTYNYYLSVDEQGNATSGPSEWIVGSNTKQSNPDFLWAPVNRVKTGYYRYHNPQLDANLINTIILSEPGELIRVNDDPTTGDLAYRGQEKLYRFNVAVEGNYTIETQLDTLDDSYIYLYSDLEEPAIAKNDDIDNGVNRASRIRINLEPGVYYLKVKGYSPEQLGQFTVEVKSTAVNDTFYYENTTVTAIPNNSHTGVNSPLLVDRNAETSSVDVSVDISHFSISDLTVELVSPDGQRYLLHDKTGLFVPSLRKTVSIDLIDVSVTGQWKLFVKDTFFLFNGQINSWSLTFKE